ncbi:MAG TPA: hypothetical protein VEH62_14340 [Gemmatimonadales bacterium]|nr:hypothetical protein [Gemmatimonadales bacterium]
MKSRYAFFGVAMLAAAGQAHAQAIQLRFTPQVGQVTHYQMTTRIWQAADTTAAPSMTMQLFQTQTVQAMDGPNYVMHTVWDSTMMGAGGRGAPDMMRGMAVTTTMDPRGHVLKSEVTPPPGLPSFIGNMMTRSANTNDNPRQRIWPEGTINPGDTWTDTMTTSTGQGRSRRQIQITMTYKYERLDHQGGHRIAVISMNGANEGFSMTGEMDVDVDAGRMAHMTTDMTSGQSGLTRMVMEVLP